MSKTKVIKLEEQLEKVIHESKELFKVVFEHSPDAITVTDGKERIVAWNPMAEKMLGMQRKDLFNQHVSVLYPLQELWTRGAFLAHTSSAGSFRISPPRSCVKTGPCSMSVLLYLVLKNAQGKDHGVYRYFV